jgi:purine nucleosidase
MKVYHNHDGGVDDFASLLTLILAPQVELVGVGVVDADTYIDPATRVTQKLLQRYDHRFLLHGLVQKPIIRFQKNGAWMLLQLMHYRFSMSLAKVMCRLLNKMLPTN